YEKVLSHLPKQPPTLLFLDLTHKNDYKGRLYIKLEPELHAFIKNVPELFTGKNGKSILGNTCGGSSGCLAIWIQNSVKEISSFRGQSILVNSGAVLCNFSGNSIRGMFLCLDSTKTYNSNYAKLGHIVYGLEVAQTCKALGLIQQVNIKISDCGLVLES
ncbi:unnamed protein product, partial [Meganyctiphanes norvegica]